MGSFKKRNVRQQRGTSSWCTNNAALVPKKTAFKAKTVGYESDYFMHGSVSDAENFNAVTKNLARLVSGKRWGGALKGGKAMRNVTAPTIACPIKPSRDEDVVDDSISPPTTTTVKRDKFDYKCNMEIYMVKYKKAMCEEEEWETCSTKIYNLLLVHCLTDLEEVLKTMTNWDLVSASEDAMGLIAMIRDVSHDKTGSKQTVMTFVKLAIEFFTFCQQVGMSNYEYAIMFKAYVEVLTAHGGTPWHYPALMHKHWDQSLAARMLAETQISADREVKVAK